MEDVSTDNWWLWPIQPVDVFPMNQRLPARKACRFLFKSVNLNQIISTRAEHSFACLQTKASLYFSATFGVSCLAYYGVHLFLLCPMIHAASLVLNAALVARQRQNDTWSFPLFFNAKHEAGQSWNVVYMTCPGIALNLPLKISRAQPTCHMPDAKNNCYCLLVFLDKISKLVDLLEVKGASAFVFCMHRFMRWHLDNLCWVQLCFCLRTISVPWLYTLDITKLQLFLCFWKVCMYTIEA